MFPWMIIPAAVPPEAPATPPTAIVEVVEAPADVFGAALGEDAMSAAAGGTATDIAQLSLNLANSDGSVSDIDADGANTGEIAGNLVNGNRGITAVFNNTGNGVIFQNTVQVNLYLNNALSE